MNIDVLFKEVPHVRKREAIETTNSFGSLWDSPNTNDQTQFHSIIS